jgi:RNA polymerase sigma-70 factor (ECF subfamily)
MTLEDIAPRTENVEKTSEEVLIKAFEMYYDKVYSFFFYHVHDHELAQDLAGEVFCRVASSWSRYDPQKATISTWVFTLAKNLLRDSWRKRKLPQVELVDMPASLDIEEDVEKMDQRRMLCKALRTLTDRERELIGLRYVAELSISEIAPLTGLTPNHISVTLFRSMKKLQKELQKTLEDVQSVP